MLKSPTVVETIGDEYDREECEPTVGVEDEDDEDDEVDDDDEDDDDDAKSACEMYSGTSVHTSSWILANAITIWEATADTAKYYKMRCDFLCVRNIHSTAYRLGELVDLIDERRCRAWRIARLSDMGKRRSIDSTVPRGRGRRESSR